MESYEWNMPKHLSNKITDAVRCPNKLVSPLPIRSSNNVDEATPLPIHKRVPLPIWPNNVDQVTPIAIRKRVRIKSSAVAGKSVNPPGTNVFGGQNIQPQHTLFGKSISAAIRGWGLC